MKHSLTFLTALLLAPLAALHAANKTASAGKPSIVIFLIDNLGWRDLGCQPLFSWSPSRSLAPHAHQP